MRSLTLELGKITRSLERQNELKKVGLVLTSTFVATLIHCMLERMHFISSDYHDSVQTSHSLYPMTGKNLFGKTRGFINAETYSALRSEKGVYLHKTRLSEKDPSSLRSKLRTNQISSWLPFQVNVMMRDSVRKLPKLFWVCHKFLLNLRIITAAALQIMPV